MARRERTGQMKGPFIWRALPAPRLARLRSTDSKASGSSGVTIGLTLCPRSTTKPTFFFGRFVSVGPVPRVARSPEAPPAGPEALDLDTLESLDLRVRHPLGTEREVVRANLQPVGTADDRAIVVGVGHLRNLISASERTNMPRVEAEAGSCRRAARQRCLRAHGGALLILWAYGWSVSQGGRRAKLPLGRSELAGIMESDEQLQPLPLSGNGDPSPPGALRGLPTNSRTPTGTSQHRADQALRESPSRPRRRQLTPPRHLPADGRR